MKKVAVKNLDKWWLRMYSCIYKIEIDIDTLQNKSMLWLEASMYASKV